MSVYHVKTPTMFCVMLQPKQTRLTISYSSSVDKEVVLQSLVYSVFLLILFVLQCVSVIYCFILWVK